MTALAGHPGLLGDGELAIVATWARPIAAASPAWCAADRPRGVRHRLGVRAERVLPGPRGRALRARLPVVNFEGGEGRGRLRLDAGDLPSGMSLDCDGHTLPAPHRRGRLRLRAGLGRVRLRGRVQSRDTVRITIER
ncbi:MAG: hypothetical protein R3F43_17885 [bacterium]